MCTHGGGVGRGRGGGGGEVWAHTHVVRGHKQGVNWARGIGDRGGGGGRGGRTRRQRIGTSWSDGSLCGRTGRSAI